MLIVDVKDFRKASDYPVEVTEESILSVLEECATPFDSPLRIRVRIKDLGRQMLTVKADLLSAKGDEFRLNIYLPMLFPEQVPEEALVKGLATYMLSVNAEIRHQCMHISQLRSQVFENGGEVELTMEEFTLLEVEASSRAVMGVAEAVRASVS